MAEPHNLLFFFSSLQIQFEEKQALQEMIRSASGIVDGAGAIRVGEIVTKVLTCTLLCYAVMPTILSMHTSKDGCPRQHMYIRLNWFEARNRLKVVTSCF